MPDRDDRPFYAVGALLAAIGIAFLVPLSRAWLLPAVVAPLRAQAEGTGGALGYSLPSLLAWAVVGGVFAWAAYELVFVRARFEPDAAFFLALAPALLLGPLLHAALVARVLPRGPLAYLASEPLVYLTIALFAGIGLALGKATRQPLWVPLGWGILGVGVVAALLAPEFTAGGLRRAGILLGLALASALLVTLAYRRLRADDGFFAVLAVTGAHALDGATTWMVLRDPFELGFQDFGERNPVSLTLVSLSNGWPYFAVKLALPVVLLLMVKREETEARLRAFLLFAVFVLGFGPGMANLIQVMLG